MPSPETQRIETVNKNVTPNVMPQKVKVMESLSVPKVKVLSESNKPAAMSFQNTLVPFKTHMEKLLEKTDPVEEARKSELSMAI